MAKPTSVTVGSAAYAEVSDDVTGVDVLQVVPTDVYSASSGAQGVELIIHSSLPAATDRGWVVTAGDFVLNAVLIDMTATGKVYAKALNGAATVLVN